MDEGAGLRAIPIMEADREKYDSQLTTNNYAKVYDKGTWGMSPQLPEYASPREEALALEARIVNGFSVDPIGGVNQPRMSATEISQRMDASMQFTTIDTSRYTHELNAPLFESSFKMCLYQNLLPKSAIIRNIIANFPEALMFKYINPLGDIQKNNNMVRFTQSVQIIQQFYGQSAVYVILDKKESLRFLKDNSGLPAALFTDPDVAEDLLNNLAKSAQQAAQSTPTPTTAATQTAALTPQGVSI